ncbi:MAG TPA: hypothetical protein DEB74_19955 [Lachnospiraceae bacterium]|nr:hypothetical protein [Lachnospiraceae bacterium]
MNLATDTNKLRTAYTAYRGGSHFTSDILQLREYIGMFFMHMDAERKYAAKAPCVQCVSKGKNFPYSIGRK